MLIDENISPIVGIFLFIKEIILLIGEVFLLIGEMSFPISGLFSSVEEMTISGVEIFSPVRKESLRIREVSPGDRTGSYSLSLFLSFFLVIKDLPAIRFSQFDTVRAGGGGAGRSHRS